MADRRRLSESTGEAAGLGSRDAVPAIRSNVQRLLAPRHIAFIGGRSVEPAIVNAVALGFEGDLWVVNPTRDELAGHPCVASVADLPEAPDATFVGVGRDRTIEVVRDLAARGAGGCVCLAAGYAEVGDRGRALQQDLAVAAGDLAVIGPNCYGLLNLVDGVALWPDLHGGVRVPAGAALLAQSGNLSLNATMADRSLRLSHVLSIGNQARTDAAAFVDVLLDDPRVHAIGLYLESVPDPTALAAVVRRARAQRVPVVALASGSSAVGAQVVAGHTGPPRPDGPVGAAEVLDRIGVVRVPTQSALLEAMKLLSVWGAGTGPSVVAVAASGGDIAVLSDLAAATPLVFPPFPTTVASTLREQLGELVTVGNPLDYNTAIWGDDDQLVRCFTTAMRGHVDAAVLVIDYPRAGTSGDASPWDRTVDAFVDAHQRSGVPAAVVSMLPEGLPSTVRERLLADGVVPLQGAAEAVAALTAAAAYGAAPAEEGADGDR